MPMKYTLPALLAALLLTSCAGVRVTDTQVATGATDPDVIYIRPFQVEGAEFTCLLYTSELPTTPYV